ncbi:50S ribosomal protein L18 [Candidatus Woesearchaeota archaeon]|nr:50S ribosomal protein L18 [Candidatus Woesearchaeota archaeon]
MNNRFTVGKRRKIEGRTDYRLRFKLLSSGVTRLIVRGSNNNTTLQVAQYTPKGDKVIASVSTKDLKKIGWNAHTGNIPAAYACGLLLASKIKGKINECIADIGPHSVTKGGRVFAAIKGTLDGGIKIPLGPENLPSEERLKGMHLTKKENNAKELIEKIRKGVAK